ncbi:hypothetical protein [Pedobacter sp. NJ-S-72]
MLKTLKKIARRIINKPDKDYEVMPITGGNAFNWKHLEDQRLYTDNNYAIEFLEDNENFDRQIPCCRKKLFITVTGMEILDVNRRFQLNRF